MPYCPCLNKSEAELVGSRGSPAYLCKKCWRYNHIEGSDLALYNWAKWECEEKYKTQLDVFNKLRGIIKQLNM